MGSSSEPCNSVQVDLVVANCHTYNTWIQFISPRPVLSPSLFLSQCCSSGYMESCQWLNYLYAYPCWNYVNLPESLWKRLALFVGFPLLFASWNFSFASSLDMVWSLFVSCYASTWLKYSALVKHPKWLSFPVEMTSCFDFRQVFIPNQCLHGWASSGHLLELAL